MGKIYPGVRNPNWKGGKVMVLCEFCEKEFQRFPSQLKNKKHLYCSRDCQCKARERKIKRICKFCGNEFSIIPVYAKRGGEFCSTKCWYGYFRKNPRLAERSEIHCKLCGKAFYVLPKNRNRKFCSRLCAATHNKKFGNKHPNWKGGSLSGSRQHARETWEEHYGIKIPTGMLIHHRDSDPFNNNISNLALLSYKAHRKTFYQGINP